MTTQSTIEGPFWERSSRCSGGQCTEVAKQADKVLLRDSKRPEQEPIAVADYAWTDFTDAVKRGEFHFDD